MPQVGPLEVLVIVFVAAMVFGPNEIPKVARQAARMWRQVQGFRADVTRHLDEALREDDGDSGEGIPVPAPTAGNEGNPPGTDRLG